MQTSRRKLLPVTISLRQIISLSLFALLSVLAAAVWVWLVAVLAELVASVLLSAGVAHPATIALPNSNTNNLDVMDIPRAGKSG